MIWLYSGTPGSGKSLHTAKDIMTKLRRGQRVIANFPINIDVVKGTGLLKHKIKSDNFVYKDNPELTVDFLVKFAKEHHKKGKEAQTLLVIDECSVIFNPREYARKDRMNWIKFMQHHRKMGYNIILISQNDKLIDKQMRSFIEYDVKHRKANNYGAIGMFFSIMQIKLFVAVEYWYGVKEKCSINFFTYKKIYSKLYDSYKMFDEELTVQEKKDSVADVIEMWKKKSLSERGGPDLSGGDQSDKQKIQEEKNVGSM